MSVNSILNPSSGSAFCILDFYIPLYLWSGSRMRTAAHPWPLTGTVDTAKLVSHRIPLPSHWGTDKDSSWSTLGSSTHVQMTLMPGENCPPDTWYCPTPLHFSEAWTINHLYNTAWRNASEPIGSSGRLESFQGSKWDFLVSCPTYSCSSKVRGAVFYASVMGFERDDQKEGSNIQKISWNQQVI